MDRYHATHVCNHSDDSGRYAYSSQPPICKWNLQTFAEDLSAHIDVTKTKAIVEEIFDPAYSTRYRALMRAKLGLRHATEADNSEDDALVVSLLETMQGTAADFTNTFRVLRFGARGEGGGRGGRGVAFGLGLRLGLGLREGLWVWF